ncbi:MAG: MAPEG family protein [Gammaproteobacteria bacterium]|nr:MAPEG family protein [Gammaproteobacteria bacterium]NND40063.1 MAPEG family protein [Pseudomonadales bacterium]
MTTISPILQPVVALLLLNCIMFFWMYATRVPAIAKMKMVLDPELPKGEQMSQLPARVRWKADNYNHLLEQPTMFYAVCLALAVIGEGSGTNLLLAWCYVGARLVHTLVQSLWNKIEIRFVIFSIGSLFLIALVVRAALLVF